MASSGLREGILAAAALVLIWAAPASGSQVETLPPAYASFRLHGTNGYSLLVSARPGEGSQEAGVDISVRRNGSAAYYRAPATVNARHIRARLGGVGRISLEFHPRGAPRIGHVKCNRRARMRYQPGSWVGEFEFEGEEGFTRVEATSAKRIIWPLLMIACPYVSEPEEENSALPGAHLLASSRGKLGTVILDAIANRPGDRLKLTAVLEERRGRMEVFRSTRGFYPGDRFSFDPGLAEAMLEPRGPFSGAATYQRLADPSARWVGDLAVDLPGRENVPLAGTLFDVSLAHARYWRERRYDERPGELVKFRCPTWLESRPCPTTPPPRSSS